MCQQMACGASSLAQGYAWPCQASAEREQLMLTQSLNDLEKLQVHVVKESFEQACHQASMARMLPAFHNRSGHELSWPACLMKISRRRLCPKGLYFRLNLSKRWKMFLSACMSKVSTLRSYLRIAPPAIRCGSGFSGSGRTSRDITPKYLLLCNR